MKLERFNVTREVTNEDEIKYFISIGYEVVEEKKTTTRRKKKEE